MKKETLPEIIAYAFILLFLYAAFSKLIIFDTYIYDLERSPLLQPVAAPLSVILPVSEIIISVLLFFPKTRRRGLYASLALMMLFTAYVGILVFTRSSLPCSCGGLIRELTWKQHFFFNVLFTGLAVLGLWLHHKNHRPDNTGSPNLNYT